VGNNQDGHEKTAQAAALASLQETVDRIAVKQAEVTLDGLADALTKDLARADVPDSRETRIMDMAMCLYQSEFNREKLAALVALAVTRSVEAK
jgi:hypothetical protein